MTLTIRKVIVLAAVGLVFLLTIPIDHRRVCSIRKRSPEYLYTSGDPCLTL